MSIFNRDNPVLYGLKSEFSSRLQKALDDCRSRDVEMRPYFGLRTPEEQAKLWRQSRSSAEIKEAIGLLRAEGANWLAGVLQDVGPQYGKWATNALPGQSWHQYGEAVDCVWIADGKAEWSTDRDGPRNGYQVYAECARNYGLTPLGPTLGDWVHVQLQPYAKPHYSWPHIDDLMRERFA